MTAKKYVLISFALLTLVVITYLVRFVQYQTGPIEFLVDSDVALTAAVLALIFSVIAIRKGSKWGWLGLAIATSPLLFGVYVYFAVSKKW
jgi:hypothetical protein